MMAITAILQLLFIGCLAYPDGAGACVTPAGNSYMSPNTAYDIRVTADVTEYSIGVPFTVTITNNGGGGLLHGFLLWAENQVGQRIGAFTPRVGIRTISCEPSAPQSTISHVQWYSTIEPSYTSMNPIVVTYTPRMFVPLNSFSLGLAYDQFVGAITFKGWGVTVGAIYDSLVPVTVTRGPDPTASPSPSPSPAPSPSTAPAIWDLQDMGFIHHVEMEYGLSVWWKALPGDGTIEMAVRGPVEGFVGVGFTDFKFAMVGADLVIGWADPDPNNPPAMNTYFAESHEYLRSDQSMQAFVVGAQSSDGTTTLIFTRTMDAGTNPIRNNRMTLIASGGSTTGIITKHTNRVNVAYVVDVNSGEVLEILNANNNRRIAHGVLCGVALTLILPFGAIVARFKSKLKKKFIPIHAGIQTLGLLLFTAGVILGYTCPIVQFRPGNWHAPLGTVIFICLYIQFFTAFLRPEPPEEGKPSTLRVIFNVLHRLFAACIFMMAIAQIVEGIILLNVPYWAYAIWAPFAGVMIILRLLVECVMIFYETR